jgi:hypothetical protein
MVVLRHPEYAGATARRREIMGTKLLRYLLMLLALSGLLSPVAAVASGTVEQNTFTKWIVTSPNMEGVVGGAVGEGSFAGEILKYTPGTTTMIEALYHFKGSIHSFSALLHIEQTGLKAVIMGMVTEGWLKGSVVAGEYTQITTDQSPNGTAFRGTISIKR